MELLKEGATAQQLVAALHQGFAASCSSPPVPESHGNDTAVVVFPPCKEAPTGGGKVPAPLAKKIEELTKSLEEEENRQVLPPERVQQLMTGSYGAALAAAKQEGYDQARAEHGTGMCLSSLPSISCLFKRSWLHISTARPCSDFGWGTLSQA